MIRRETSDQIRAPTSPHRYIVRSIVDLLDGVDSEDVRKFLQGISFPIGYYLGEKYYQKSDTEKPTMRKPTEILDSNLEQRKLRNILGA